jgi:choice-of-anchor B domain-containing protein
MKSSTFFFSVIQKCLFVGFLSLFLFLPKQALTQLNVDSLSHVNYQQLHDANLNDVWGYVDEMGNEYALVGTSKGTSIVNVTDPTNPVEVFWLPGSTSIWRDPSSHGDYAYVTTEAEDGLLIIDLSPLPQDTNLTTTLYTGPANNPWQSAHTCFVDENGYAYVFGANRGNGGVIILDVFTNPMAPIEVGVFDNWYCHDGYVRNDTMYLANIYAGFFSLVDVSDKANPVLLGTKTTPSSFTHNSWPSDNGQYVFTTDEISGAFIAAYDISDPTNIVEVDRIQNSPGSGIIPHNTHVMGDYLITSYYSDGVVIHDITYPYNIIKVAEYDTYEGQTISYDGCWGVYPFLPSGTILAADITNGLFVLGPTYQQAAYLEGIVRDQQSNLPLNDVFVKIVGDDQSDLTNSSGFYATGIFSPGIYNVTYEKVGYFPKTESVTLIQGQIVIQNTELIPIPPYNLDIKVYELGTTIPISGAQIKLIHPLLVHEGITNGIGEESLTLYYQDGAFYNIQVGKWGFVTSCFDMQLDSSTGSIIVYLEKGYYDDFEFDFSWTIIGNATTGLWERGIPNPTNNTMIGTDAPYDCGSIGFVTGNAANLNSDFDDVDEGYTTLISPQMDLTSLSNPHINFARSFFCYHGPGQFDDTLKVFISNGSTSVLLDQIGGPQGNEMSYAFQSIPINGLLTINNTMQIYVTISDENPNINITEAAFDHFWVSNYITTDILETTKEEFSLYPNPSNEKITIENAEIDSYVHIRDLNGKVQKTIQVSANKMEIDLQCLTAGIYIIQNLGQSIRFIKL